MLILFSVHIIAHNNGTLFYRSVKLPVIPLTILR
jgi:hypothetical protein